MTVDDFRILHAERVAAHPRVFVHSSPDTPATDVQLADLQSHLGVALPPSFVEFLKEFGGGDFGLVNVFSANPSSSWYLLKRQDPRGLADDFVTISDDGTGGRYAYRIAGSIAMDPIVFLDEMGVCQTTEYSNIFDFVADLAY